MTINPCDLAVTIHGITIAGRDVFWDDIGCLDDKIIWALYVYDDHGQRDYLDVPDYLARDLVAALETLRTVDGDTTLRYERAEADREHKAQTVING